MQIFTLLENFSSPFSQGGVKYILPEKFGIDKRKVHLSSLIRNSEITRDEALQELSLPLYDPFELRNNKEYVLKKLGFTEDEFEGIMQTPPQAHSYYPSNSRAVNFLKQLKNITGVST